jgi:hypothetical protein
MNPQDPLAQLRDIHLPEPVSWWPPAPGWWLLAVLVLIALAAISLFFYKRYQHNSFRRQALQLLENHFLDWQHNQNTSLYLQQVNSVLKRTALLCFPEADVAALSGTEWTLFLDRHSPAPASSFSDGPLTQGPYAPPSSDQDIEGLQRLAELWLRRHREPDNA